MKILRTLIGIVGLLAFMSGALQIQFLHNILFSPGPWAIGIQVVVGLFLAYCIGKARSGEKFSWSEEITWAAVEIMLFFLIALTPIPASQFLITHSAWLCVIIGVGVFVYNLTQ